MSFVCSDMQGMPAKTAACNLMKIEDGVVGRQFSELDSRVVKEFVHGVSVSTAVYGVVWWVGCQRVASRATKSCLCLQTVNDSPP